MSSSLSIFQKLCPSCASSQPVGAERCDCGHEFETDGSNGASAEEAALRDEELYENYLVARATQAQEAARAAEDALAENPDNPENTAAAELARQVAQSIQSDLAEQQKKIAALRATIDSAVRPTPAPSDRPVPAKPSQTVRTSPVGGRAPADAGSKSTPARAPKSAAAPAQKVSLPPVKVSGKAIAALEALKNAKAREVVERTQRAVPTAPAVPAPVAAAEISSGLPAQPITTPSVTNTPPATFRAEQAAKAGKVMDALHTSAAPHKECPNCTASVPTATSRCRCGFAFSGGGNDMPTLTLCTGDFTALRNSFNLHLRGRS